MILIYTLGDMTRRYNLINKEGQKGYLVYITATAAIFIINEIIPLIPYNSTYLNIKLYSYNNPLVIIASIALFCFIAKYKFHSNGINNIAKYAFALYLVQDCYPFGGYLYNSLYEHAQSANTLLCIIVYLCVLFLLTYILEKTRRFILNKPIDKLSDFLEKKINISQE
jgi:membrane-bound acyltransferase YfiQ involved in biofilm formation